MACVAAPIIGGPRPPPAQRRTHPTPPKNPIGPAYHTLKCEEPVNPARAGMIPGEHRETGGRTRKPRASGDDPPLGGSALDHRG